MEVIRISLSFGVSVFECRTHHSAWVLGLFVWLPRCCSSLGNLGHCSRQRWISAPIECLLFVFKRLLWNICRLVILEFLFSSSTCCSLRIWWWRIILWICRQQRLLASAPSHLSVFETFWEVFAFRSSA